MPSKIRPRDWDYYFGTNAPRRGGPLRALSNVLIFGLVLALLGAGGLFAARSFETQRTQVRQTSQAQALLNTQILATRTAGAQSTAEAAIAAQAQQEATAIAAPPTPAVPLIGVGSVVAGGNLRREPVVSPDTVLGLIYPGDEVAFLDQQNAGGGLWYLIRVTRVGPARTGDGVSEGTEGWASSTLLSPPAPSSP